MAPPAPSPRCAQGGGLRRPAPASPAGPGPAGFGRSRRRGLPLLGAQRTRGGCGWGLGPSTALSVMAGLVPAIHDLTTTMGREVVDARHRAGHDAWWFGSLTEARGEEVLEASGEGASLTSPRRGEVGRRPGEGASHQPRGHSPSPASLTLGDLSPPGRGEVASSSHLVDQRHDLLSEVSVAANDPTNMLSRRSALTVSCRSIFCPGVIAWFTVEYCAMRKILSSCASFCRTLPSQISTMKGKSMLKG